MVAASSEIPMSANVLVVLLRAGRLAEVRELYATQGLTLGPETWFSLIGDSLAAEVAAEMGDRELAMRVYARLAPFAGRPATAAASAAIWPVDWFLAVAAAAPARKPSRQHMPMTPSDCAAAGGSNRPSVGSGTSAGASDSDRGSNRSHIYHTERPHQWSTWPDDAAAGKGCHPGRRATRPKPTKPNVAAPVGVRGQGDRETTIQRHGDGHLHGIKFQRASKRSGQAVHAVWDGTSVVFAESNREVLIEHPWPPEGTTSTSATASAAAATVSLAYACDSRVHLHSQTAPTSGSSWSSTCSKPSDTRTPVDGFGPGRVCAMT